MKLGILTALWGRPVMTLIFLDRMKSIIDKYGIKVIAVGSDNEFKEDCEERGIIYTDHINKPLGAKWNQGLSACKDVDVDTIMVLGSDDLPSDNFIEYELEFAKDIDFGGGKDMYMIGANHKRRGWGEFFYFRYNSYLIGPGRVYSRRILELLNWTGWAVNRNSGLDGSIAKAVKLLGGTVRRGSFFVRDNDLFIVDVKTLGNISGIPGAAKPVTDGTVDEYLHKYLPDEAGRILKLLP